MRSRGCFHKNERRRYIFAHVKRPVKRPRVKLSEMYQSIGDYLQSNGDAEVRSIATCVGLKDGTAYELNLCDLSKDGYEVIGKIPVKSKKC